MKEIPLPEGRVELVTCFLLCSAPVNLVGQAAASCISSSFDQKPFQPQSSASVAVCNTVHIRSLVPAPVIDNLEAWTVVALQNTGTILCSVFLHICGKAGCRQQTPSRPLHQTLSFPALVLPGHFAAVKAASGAIQSQEQLPITALMAHALLKGFAAPRGCGFAGC